MKRQLLAIIVITGVAGAAAPAFAQNEQLAALGKTVFAGKSCSLCHSVAGKGNQKGPLDQVIKNLSSEEIRQWLVDPQTMRAKSGAERKPAMKSYAALSKDELDGLVAYLESLKGSK